MNCKKYTIEGKNTYTVLVDPRNIIISCEKPNENLLFKNFRDIFDKYKDLMTFSFKGEELYPLVVQEDIIEVFRQKNPGMDKLIETFNLTL